MVYDPLVEEDQIMHMKFHKRFQKGISYYGWKQERVVKSFPEDGTRIVMITYDSPSILQKKIEEVLDVVNIEMGYLRPNKDDASKKNEKTFLFISNNKTIAGCIIVEELKQAYKQTKGEEDGTFSFSKEIPLRAACGIVLIWVHKNERRKGIAFKLIEQARSHFMYGYTIPKDLIAFSQPTPEGKAFATKYFETINFLVY